MPSQLNAPSGLLKSAWLVKQEVLSPAPARLQNALTPGTSRKLGAPGMQAFRRADWQPAGPGDVWACGGHPWATRESVWACRHRLTLPACLNCPMMTRTGQLMASTCTVVST